MEYSDILGTNLKPFPREVEVAEKLQKLFNFDTDITYHIYNFSEKAEERVCTIQIEASHEPYPHVHTSDDRADYLRGPNSIVVAKFAREKLPKGDRIWYCARKGFMIHLEAAEAYLASN